MDMYDFISGGGYYKTSAGYSANITSILVKSGNTYPLIGTIAFTNNYSISTQWDANGIVQYTSSSNQGLDLVPVFTIINYAAAQTDSLSAYSNTAAWNAAHDIINYDRIISY